MFSIITGVLSIYSFCFENVENKRGESSIMKKIKLKFQKFYRILTITLYAKKKPRDSWNKRLRTAKEIISNRKSVQASAFFFEQAFWLRDPKIIKLLLF